MAALTRKLRILPSPPALAPLSQAWEQRIEREETSRSMRQDRGAGGEGKGFRSRS